MNNQSFRALDVDARLRYLDTVRGIPKDAIAIVEQTDLTDDGFGNDVEGICRIRIVTMPEGSRRMPFMDDLLIIFESESELFEQVV